MSHEVETMAYTNQVPWHGLGFSRPEGFKDVKQLIKDAKLDWKVERRPIYTTNPDHAERINNIEGFAALVRDKDNAVFDIVGSRYQPIQNEEAFEFFTEFVEAGKAKMETAGSLRGGKYVWGLANLGTEFRLKGKDDVVKGYLLVGCPHEQGKSLIIKFTSVRVVCNNTLTLALRNKGNEVRISHRAAFDNATMNRAKETLGIAREQMGDLETNAQKLLKLKVNRNDAIRVLASVFAPDADMKEILADFDKATPRLKSLMDVYEKAPGAEPGNGWGVLAATTYYADHVASRTADKRLANAWLGRTANQKEAVLDKLLDMAA